MVTGVSSSPEVAKKSVVVRQIRGQARKPSEQVRIRKAPSKAHIYVLTQGYVDQAGFKTECLRLNAVKLTAV